MHTSFYFFFSESVSFELDNTAEFIDTQLMALVTRCKRLRELNVNAMISVHTVEAICELLRDRKIGKSRA